MKPPLAAAFVPVSIVSLCSPPGSRKCTWTSTNPGAIKLPLASITSIFGDEELILLLIVLIRLPSIKISVSFKIPFLKIFPFLINFIFKITPSYFKSALITAILKYIPFSICLKMRDFGASTKSLLISTPRLTGAGCMTMASSFNLSYLD